MNWRSLIPQLPAWRSRERVPVWWPVQKVGAILYRDSISALTASNERREDLQSGTPLLAALDRQLVNAKPTGANR